QVWANGRENIWYVSLDPWLEHTSSVSARDPLLCILLSVDCHASEMSSNQEASSKSVSVPPVAARPEDVSTIDGIVKALYESISGPPGQPRQWSRDRTLYIESVQFIAMNEDAAHHPTARV